MPRKVRQLIADLEKAGFMNRGGKGSHWNFTHPAVLGKESADDADEAWLPRFKEKPASDEGGGSL